MLGRTRCRIWASATVCTLRLVEFARNVGGIADANSTEVDPTTGNPVIGLVTEWTDREGQVETRTSDDDYGGTMRLGAQTCLLEPSSLASKLYGR